MYLEIGSDNFTLPLSTSVRNLGCLLAGCWGSNFFGVSIVFIVYVHQYDIYTYTHVHKCTHTHTCSLSNIGFKEFSFEQGVQKSARERRSHQWLRAAVQAAKGA